jgi:hypothetical protein
VLRFPLPILLAARNIGGHRVASGNVGNTCPIGNGGSCIGLRIYKWPRTVHGKNSATRGSCEHEQNQTQEFAHAKSRKERGRNRTRFVPFEKEQLPSISQWSIFDQPPQGAMPTVLRGREIGKRFSTPKLARYCRKSNGVPSNQYPRQDSNESRVSRAKTLIRERRDAHSDAHSVSELVRIIAAWPNLSGAARRQILAIIRKAVGRR